MDVISKKSVVNLSAENETARNKKENAIKASPLAASGAPFKSGSLSSLLCSVAVSETARPNK